MGAPRFSLSGIVSVAVFLFAGRAIGSPTHTSEMELAGRGQCFIENKGQWDARAQFMAQSGGIDSWITEEGVVYDFHKFVPVPNQPSRLGRRRPPKGTRIGQVVKISFANARPGVATASGELGGKLNYFLGNDKSQWATGVRRFSEARSQEIYDGISVPTSVNLAPAAISSVSFASSPVNGGSVATGTVALLG